MEDMKRVEFKTQTRSPASAVEPVECHEGQHQEASAASLTLGRTQHPGTEDLQALREEVLCLIAKNYILATPPQCSDDHIRFEAYMKEMRTIITGVDMGSLLITVQCESLQVLEELWEDYLSGHLGEVVQESFATKEILKTLNLSELKLKTTIEEEDYKKCKAYFEKDALRG